MMGVEENWSVERWGGLGNTEELTNETDGKKGKEGKKKKRAKLDGNRSTTAT